VRRLVTRPDSKTRLSVSATTRSPRPGEEHGREYYFLSRQEFESSRERDEFLESAEVHGNFYGTPSAPVRDTLSQGDCVILEIDVQGALQVLERYPSSVLVFVNTPSFEVLEARLRGRSTEDESMIQVRLGNARAEIALSHRYHHQLINAELDQAVDDLASLLSSLGCGGSSRDA
jgi:guanylate kinase